MSRKELILEHYDYAKILAYNFCGSRGILKEIDDFTSAAIVLMIEAIDTYDKNKGKKLKSWIYFKLNKGLIDYTRWWMPGSRLDYPKVKEGLLQPISFIDIDEVDFEYSRDIIEEMHKKELFIKVVEASSILSRCEFELFISYYIEKKKNKELVVAWMGKGCSYANLHFLKCKMLKKFKNHFEAKE